MRYLLLFTLLFLNLKTFAASLSLEDQNSKASNFLFIGLSSSAKSTLANTLREELENSENIRIHSFDTHANLFFWLSAWNFFSNLSTNGHNVNYQVDTKCRKSSIYSSTSPNC